MHGLRLVAYGLPTFFTILLVGSFLSTSSLKTGHKNELTIGTIGEPTTLNPIQEADAAASDVEGLLFQGLLTYDENLEIVPDLAESYTIRQVTTLYFHTAEQAQAAATKLGASSSAWTQGSLDTVEPIGTKLILNLKEPGLDASNQIAALFPETERQSLVILRAEPGNHARSLVKQFQSQFPDHTFERSWFDYDAAFEITCLQSQAFIIQKQLETFLKEQKIAQSVVTITNTLPFLAEPVIHFVLRKDVKWHDGAPFTSRDAAFTFEKINDPTVASPRKADFDLVQKVEAPSPHDFIVTYRKPFSPALNSWMTALIPAHILEKLPVNTWGETFNRHPIGTGPFRFDSWQTNQSIRIVRNPTYFEGAPWLDAIVFRVLPDPITLRIAFESHEIDFWSVDPWAVASFKKDPRFEVFRFPSKSYTFVAWNLADPLFQDIRVRRAFAHSVNIPQMIEFILYGNGVQSTGIFLPQYWFADANLKPIAYDVDAAKRLLEEAGWKLGPDGIRTKNGQRLTFTLRTNQANEVRKDIATLVQDNLRSVGAEVHIEIYEWAVFINRFINKGEFDAIALGWSLPPDYDQYAIWHSSQVNPEQLNFIKYKNPKVDTLLDALRQEFNRERIIELASEVQRLIYEDQPYLFLFVPEATVVLWQNSLRVCRPTPNGWHASPIELTKAGWSYYMQWFYRPEFPPSVLHRN